MTEEPSSKLNTTRNKILSISELIGYAVSENMVGSSCFKKVFYLVVLKFG